MRRVDIVIGGFKAVWQWLIFGYLCAFLPFIILPVELVNGYEKSYENNFLEAFLRGDVTLILIPVVCTLIGELKVDRFFGDLLASTLTIVGLIVLFLLMRDLFLLWSSRGLDFNTTGVIKRQIFYISAILLYGVSIKLIVSVVVADSRRKEIIKKMEEYEREIKEKMEGINSNV